MSIRGLLDSNLLFQLFYDQKAKKYASILGYNYNSGDWFKQSYKILNKDYKISKKMKISDKKDKNKKSFFKKIIEIIK